MNWYYVENGQQAGPVDEAQLEEMLRAGRIAPETLVWRDGMGNWQPYSVARPGELRMSSAPGSAMPSGNEAVCSECGRMFDKSEMISYGGAQVCAGCKPVFMQKLAEGAQLNVGALQYAGFWIRVGAKLIDGLILGALFIVPIIILSLRSATNPSLRLQLIQIGVQLLYVAGNAVYTIFFLGKYGATPGKMACKIQVVTADGGKIGYGRATGRFFAEMLSGIICYIGYIIAAFDDQKRALHDHICNTRVVYKQS